MRKIRSFLIATGVLLLLFVPSIGIADIDEDVMTAGDTFIYEVTDFDIPWNDLFGGVDSPFPFADLVLDLSGSTLAFKVMAVDNYGYYMLNSYVILGEVIKIPIPEGEGEESIPLVTEVFGNQLVIPEGVGIGLGVSIPGSDFIEFIDENYNAETGLPFYFDPNSWDDYEDMFEDLADELGSAVDVTVTNEAGGDEFKVEFSGHIGSGEDYTTELYSSEAPSVIGIGVPAVDITLAVAWHQKGDYAGVFKRVSGQITGDLMDNGNEITLDIEVSFAEKRHNPLPDEILDEETITLELDKGSFTYDATGFFEDNEFDEFLNVLDVVEDELGNAVGEDIFEFEVTDVEGCYYETDIYLYDGRNLELSAERAWWNGFNGFPTSLDNWASGPWEDWAFSPTIGILPIMAPGITPDWDMWQASILSLSSIIETIEDAVTSTTAAAELEAAGATVNEFDVTYEMRANKDFKFFFFEADVDIAIDTSDMEGFTNEDEIYPAGAATAFLQLWLAYTHEGLIAGAGAIANVEVDLTNVPIGEDPYTYDTIYDNGSISFDLEAELRNSAISTLPDPTALPKDTEGEDGDGGGGITPGFAIIPALLMFAAIAVIIKRRK